MLRSWTVDITNDIGTTSYIVEADDSYDAKLKALQRFYDEFGTPAHLSDVELCVEI